MLIIIDSRVPKEAIVQLQKLGEVFPFDSASIVYESIQSHPDIFLFQMEELVIIAPNTPKDLIDALKKHRIPFLRGKSKVGKKFPETVFYNAVSTQKYLFHKKDFTDDCVLHETSKKEFVNVSQAYTRCNLLELPDGSFITADRGIEKILKEKKLEVHFFSSEDVLLQGQDHGFLPGACGIFQNSVYVIGKLDSYQEGERLKNLVQSKGMELVELYDGPIIDGGGIFFLKP